MRKGRIHLPNLTKKKKVFFPLPTPPIKHFYVTNGHSNERRGELKTLQLCDYLRM